jgi:hypothetical protein
MKAWTYPAILSTGRAFAMLEMRSLATHGPRDVSLCPLVNQQTETLRILAFASFSSHPSLDDALARERESNR